MTIARDDIVALLRLARLSMGGSLLALAIANMVGSRLGIEVHTSTEGLSAGIGFALSALGLKLAHVS